MKNKIRTHKDNSPACCRRYFLYLLYGLLKAKGQKHFPLIDFAKI
jgi:hypothetical protein